MALALASVRWKNHITDRDIVSRTNSRVATLPSMNPLMSNPSASIFPNHKYDFGDSVFVPALQVTGTIEGIRHYPERNTWRYLLAA